MAAGLLAGLAHAQALPDAGALMREAQRAPPAPPARETSASPPPTTPAASTTTVRDGGLRFTVQRFRIVGNSLVQEADLQEVLRPWLQRPIGFLDLEQAAFAVSEVYARRGWYVRTQWPEQDIHDGQVMLNVIEGKLGKVRLDSGNEPLRLRQEIAVGMVTARQRPGEPLKLGDVERATQLLNDTPGVQATVALATGEHPGEADVIVHARNKPLVTGALQFDNHGARSTGDKRLGASANLDNGTGRGDQAALNSLVSEGSTYLKLSYALPLGNDGLRVGLNTSWMRYRLLHEFAALQAQGDARSVGLSGSYPLVRSASRNLVVQGSLEQRQYVNRANGIETSHKRHQAWQLALNGDAADLANPGTFTVWGLALTAGQVNLAGNAVNQAADQAGPRTEGRFTKLGANLARLQSLGSHTGLWLSGTAQAAGKNLDSSEKFSLGGAHGVRAYPALEGQGDSGWLGNVELRHQLSPDLRGLVFYDHGRVQVNRDPGYPGAPTLNNYALRGYGLGLSWQLPGGHALRAMVARRVGSNPAANTTTGMDSDGSKTGSRFWLSGIVYL